MTADPLPAWADGLDGRALRILAEVWARVPDHERALLAAVIREVGIGAPQAGVLAWVGDMTADLRVRVDLGRLAEVIDDAAARWIVAHELSHAAMRHGLIAPIGGLRVLVSASSTDAEDDAVNGYLEDAANFLAAVGWGFGTELHAFLAAYPRSPRPRWLGEVSGNV